MFYPGPVSEVQFSQNQIDFHMSGIRMNARKTNKKNLCTKVKIENNKTK